ncbi:conserved hypothetical protein [Tenacibaculum sp. 190524A05c]|uniref:hypothetical protein n=1 Tax=Tenacibaculum platacis TaxID=3137852 RepID=UPI0031FA9E04
MTEFEIIQKIKEELLKAEQKHPFWPDDILHQIAIVNEESGEATRAALQFQYEEGELDEVKNELIQTAAMCIRMLKNLENVSRIKTN